MNFQIVTSTLQVFEFHYFKGKLLTQDFSARLFPSISLCCKQDLKFATSL